MTKHELKDFIKMNIPIGIKPEKNSKKMFINPFTSGYAMSIVIETLTDKIWDKIHELRNT